jgi:hypothetical protein
MVVMPMPKADASTVTDILNNPAMALVIKEQMDNGAVK